MIKNRIIPANNILQPPYIRVDVEVMAPGETNGMPNIKKDCNYVVAPSAKKISQYIVNQIFGSELVTQTEGLSISWLMPTLKKALELGIYETESFVYIHKFDDKIYLECYQKNEIHDLIQKFDKVVSCKIKQEFDGIFEDKTRYILERKITIDKGNSYIEMSAYSINNRNEKSEVSLAIFNKMTGNDYLPKYILPYECLINIDLGEDFFKDSKKFLTEEMVIINTLNDEIDKTKTKIVTSEHYQSGDIVTNWKPQSTHYQVNTLTVGQLQDYFTLLPGDKDHQIFEFLQGDIRFQEYISSFKFYDQQIIQMAGLSPASFGYEKDAYMNTDNVNLSKNASDMTVEAIKTQIEPQINKLIENIVKAQRSQGIEINLIPETMMWDYGVNEKFDDMKKLQVLGRIQNVAKVPYQYRAKIIMPILNKLIDEDYSNINKEQIEELIKRNLEEEESLKIEYGEI